MSCGPMSWPSYRESTMMQDGAFYEFVCVCVFVCLLFIVGDLEGGPHRRHVFVVLLCQRPSVSACVVLVLTAPTCLLLQLLAFLLSEAPCLLRGLRSLSCVTSSAYVCFQMEASHPRSCVFSLFLLLLLRVSSASESVSVPNILLVHPLLFQPQYFLLNEQQPSLPCLQYSSISNLSSPRIPHVALQFS